MEPMKTPNEKTLTVIIPGSAVDMLRGWSVMVYRSTVVGPTIACVLEPIDSALPTRVTLGGLHAYVTNIEPPFHECQIVEASLPTSQPLVPHTLYRFDGAEWLSDDHTPDDFLYGLCNGLEGRGSRLGFGLAQPISINGAASTLVPVNLEVLLGHSTTFFPANERYAIGVVRIAGIEAHPGLLLSTRTSAASLLASSSPCVPTLGPFSPLDFTHADRLIAEYSPDTNDFSVTPG